ncbi:hypothetical protein AVEN_218069-1 [Araneus ventricosus]|uniref:Tc1-like transposase DDE domain-containing protein n=1 Tax=Araneus ventricosus TaxID=182803 RepID=A0A4Y2MRB0_ARAVE|nr:hypothetical protein AVEN_218069-1 [Araneus ventricosus]
MYFDQEDLPLSDLQNVWFEHDGAPLHKVSSVQQYIWDTFQQQVIEYGGCVEWPPHSPDLNPLDFFLWGYIKQRVYATPLPTLQKLRNRITDGSFHVKSTQFLNKIYLTISDFHEIFQRCTIDIDLEKYQISSRYVDSFLIAGTSKPYYGCLCQRVTCHVVQCAAGSADLCPDVYCC